ncbi:hypothetical protein [Paraburkholderia sp. J94]|uniref:hypothetical protein n=1 Tax=Paraburkholderia sp. J94 TaxID=2805441 RepID=UPI002AB0D2E8|nr:hypothetical protein [Paraburkholderia sp. J94]
MAFQKVYANFSEKVSEKVNTWWISWHRTKRLNFPSRLPIMQRMNPRECFIDSRKAAHPRCYAIRTISITAFVIESGVAPPNGMHIQSRLIADGVPEYDVPRDAPRNAPLRRTV